VERNQDQRPDSLQRGREDLERRVRPGEHSPPGRRKDARDFVKRVEEDGLVRLQGLGKQLNVDEFVGKLKVSDLTEQVSRITQETIDKLGLVSATELASLRDELTALNAELAGLKEIKTKANSAATKSTVTKLTKRVAALEKKAKKA